MHEHHKKYLMVGVVAVLAVIVAQNIPGLASYVRGDKRFVGTNGTA